MKNLEHQQQAALFHWAALSTKKHPELALLFAIPNGGHRHISVAVRLKAEGVKRGVPDVCLPVPRGTFHGLWVEMKAGKGKPTTEQETWIRLLLEQGHMVKVCYSWQAAVDAIEEYLNIQKRVKKPSRGP